MYEIDVNFNTATRMLSDDLRARQRIIDTRGDNDVTMFRFNIIGSIPNEFEGRVEFDILVKDDTPGIAYKPYIPLENNEAVLPNRILKWADRKSLPIQLVFENPTTKERFCSFNMLTYTIKNAVMAKR